MPDAPSPVKRRRRRRLYQIANIAALQVAQLLDAEYMAAEAMSWFADNPDLGRPETEKQAIALIAADRDTVLTDPGITARARDYTVGRIERALADALDTPATEQEGG